jgi:hypothetical protein
MLGEGLDVRIVFRFDESDVKHFERDASSFVWIVSSDRGWDGEEEEEEEDDAWNFVGGGVIGRNNGEERRTNLGDDDDVALCDGRRYDD